MSESDPETDFPDREPILRASIKNHGSWATQRFSLARLSRWLLAASIGLTGCTVVGPDFHGAPSPALESNFHAAQSPATAPTLAHRPQADPITWWSSFSDPMLDQLIQKSLQQNRSAQTAAERIIESRARLQRVGGQLLPDVDSESGYQFRKQSLNTEPYAGPNSTPYSLFAMGLDSRWEIDLFGRIERSIQAAEAELNAQCATLEEIQQMLTAEVAISYLSIRSLQERIALYEYALALQDQTLELVSERTEAGVASELDRQQTRGLQQRTAAQREQLQQSLDLEFNRLHLLLGEVPNHATRTWLGTGAVPQTPLLPATGMPAELLHRRPDLRRAEANAAKECAEIGIAESELYPALTLRGTIALNGRDATRLFQSESLTFGVGPGVRWNILHFGTICDQIEVESSQFRQALQQYEQAVLQAVGEVEDCLATFSGQQRRLEKLEQACQADVKAVKLGLDRYKAGRANFQRIIDTQQTLLDDSDAAVVARTESLLQLVRLYKATGGGWPGPTASASTAVGTPNYPMETGNFGSSEYSVLSQSPQPWQDYFVRDRRIRSNQPSTGPMNSIQHVDMKQATPSGDDSTVVPASFQQGDLRLPAKPNPPVAVMPNRYPLARLAESSSLPSMFRNTGIADSPATSSGSPVSTSEGVIQTMQWEPDNGR